MLWQKTSRKYHKWLMLFIGLQFMVWAISGVYMVVMDIDYIHGDSLVSPQVSFIESKDINYSISQLLTDYPDAKNIELGTMLEHTVYRFKLINKVQVLFAKNGALLGPINKAIARDIAKKAYADKNSAITEVSLISEQTLRELSPRHLPVWRVNFDDFASSTFYISVHSAKIVTKRHSFWRVFDWMFAFHVMDYVDEAPDNKLLLLFILFALPASLFGLVLTYFSTIKTNTFVKSSVKSLRVRPGTLHK